MRRAWAPTPAIFALALLPALAACSGEPGEQGAPETEVPQDLARFEAPAVVDAGLGTPREERVATIGLLNKRNNLTQDIEMKPGESRRVGDVIVRLATCERTPPWEVPSETGAFLQVLVARRASPTAAPEWVRAFSGWLFKNSPSLNVVEHPIYDVWVKDCAMSFPGEEEAVAGERSATSPAPAAAPAAAATPSPAPLPAAAPSPAPAAASASNDE